MNTSLFSRLFQPARPTRSVPAESAPLDEYLISQPERVRAQLRELAELARQLQWQCDDSAARGAARLQLCGNWAELVIEPLDALAPPRRVNLIAASSQGVLMFSLHDLRQTADGRWSGPLPGQILRVQSRRHYRVHGIAGPTHRAILELSEQAKPLALRDLSEEGCSMVWEGAPDALASSQQHARLYLDEQRLEVPCVQIVHRGASAGRAGSVLGAQLIGLAPPDAQRLRQWLSRVQASQVLRSASQRD